MFFKKCVYLFFSFIVISSTAYSAKKEFTHADIKTSTVEIEGHKEYYDSIGEGDEYVVLLHGLFGNSGVWHKIMPALANDGFKVIAPDLPGYGWSLGFPIYDYDLKRQVALLLEFVDKLKIEKFHVAGNSLGSTLAVSFMNKYHTRIKSITFLGSPAGFSFWSKDLHKAITEGNNPFIPKTADQFKEEMKLLFFNPPDYPMEFIKKKLKVYKKNALLDTQIWDIVNIDLYNFVIADQLYTKCPMLILWGKEDKIFSPEEAQKLHKRVPGSELVLMPKAGHLLVLEYHKHVADIYIKFLNKHK
ncbi:MAG TPA: alpha/beta hydrolase [Victivallales bacterium]|nr:alpha/beta hydrolase [Victivallales bacterium]